MIEPDPLFTRPGIWFARLIRKGHKMTKRFWLYGGLAVVAIPVLPLILLPSKAHVERSILVSASPSTVFAVVRSQRGFDRFNPFKIEDPSLKTEFTGPDFGPGATMSWRGKAGEGKQTVLRETRNRSVVMQLDLGVQGRPLQTFRLSEALGGTRVTWALDADLGMNPVARVFGLQLDRMLGPTYETGLARLKRVAENRG